jgi:hypothetical protein
MSMVQRTKKAARTITEPRASGQSNHLHQEKSVSPYSRPATKYWGRAAHCTPRRLVSMYKCQSALGQKRPRPTMRHLSGFSPKEVLVWPASGFRSFLTPRFPQCHDDKITRR